MAVPATPLANYPLGRQAIEELVHHGGEPQWLRDVRLQAWQRFEQLPLPSRTQEEWRRTDVSKLSFDGLVAAATGKEVLTRQPGPGDEWKERGVIFTDLQTAAREYGELVRDLVGTGIPEDKFTALNTATWAGGTFVYVPRDVEVELPLQIRSRSEQPNLSLAGRTLVVAEPGARVTVLEWHEGRPGLHTHVVSVHARCGAQVRYVSVQNFRPEVKSFVVREAFVDDDARVDWLLVELGALLSRAEVTSRLVGQGSRSESLLLLFGDGAQHLDVGLNALLEAPHARSDTQVRSVLGGRARGIYRGKGHIHKSGRQGWLYQRHNALLLSPTARNDSSPSLLIDTRDVEAGHAATAGRVDDDQLFYLQARGIDERTARRMIVEGFVTPIIEALPTEALQQELRTLVERKLSA